MATERARAVSLCVALTIFACPAIAHASTSDAVAPSSLVLLAIALIASGASTVFARRVGFPPVLAELGVGVVLGMLTGIRHIPIADVRRDPLIAALAEIGIILLMFEAGLEGTLREVRRVLRPATIVAFAGVIIPVALGGAVLAVAVPHQPLALYLFLASALAATSVGITARVLQDANATHSKEAQVILGAAVIDDVLGLLLLAAVTGIASGGFSATSLLVIVGRAVVFLVAAIALGQLLAGQILALPARFGPVQWGTTLTLALGLAFATSAGAAVAGLAPLIGAFAAGLVLDEVEVKVGMEPGRLLGSYVAPVAAFLSPLFFVRVGATLDVAALAKPFALLVGAALAVVALGGKYAAGLLLGRKDIDGAMVGIGMIPRGEVGLIFLELGRRLPDPAHPALSPSAHAAGMLMVIATTLVGPLWLGRRLHRRP
jgi:Kef-type K+ transport system membrane component KefB